MLLATEIQGRYSGSGFNADPDTSVGGMMSPTPIRSNAYENLFNSFPERVRGQTFRDYRAIYIVNTSETDSFYNVRVWLAEQNADGADVKIGIPVSNEVQQITFVDPTSITGGTFSLKYGLEATADIDWDSDFNVVCDRIIDALNDLETLSGVTLVSAEVDDNAVGIFEFAGQDSHKFHPKLGFYSNQLTLASGFAKTAVAVTVNGSPINAIAVDVAFPNNPPSGITFTSPTEDSPVEIGTLQPGDNFYVWFQRSIPPNTDTSLLEDNCTLRYSGQYIDDSV